MTTLVVIKKIKIQMLVLEKNFSFHQIYLSLTYYKFYSRFVTAQIDDGSTKLKDGLNEYDPNVS